MAKPKYNNKVLLGVLVALVAVYFLTDLMRGRRERAQQVPQQLLVLDSTLVDGIRIDPAQGTPLELRRRGGGWVIERPGGSLSANPNTVRQLFAQLDGLEPERLIARNPDAWANYAVEDSAATRVAFSAGAEPLAALFIGRFNYQPPPQGANPMGQTPQLSGTTYVRREGDDAVYSVDGFLSMSIPTELSAWRRNDFLRLDPLAVRQVRFAYPGAAFTLQEGADGWSVGGQAADSLVVVQYLNLFSNRPNRQFAEGFREAAPPTHTITLRGENMSDLVLQAWPNDEDGFILQSSLNREAYFRSNGDGLFDQLFVEPEHFRGE